MILNQLRLLSSLKDKKMARKRQRNPKPRLLTERESSVSRISSMTSSSFVKTSRKLFPNQSGLIPIMSPYHPL